MYVDTVGTGEGRRRLVGMNAADAPVATVPCALVATAALDIATSLSREAVHFSLSVCRPCWTLLLCPTRWL